MTWPPFKLDRDCKAVLILKDAAEKGFGKSVNLDVCGPSNTGNYFAANHIPACCGFGVGYENLHSANECIFVDTILPVYETYLKAVFEWSNNLDYEKPQSRYDQLRSSNFDLADIT